MTKLADQIAEVDNEVELGRSNHEHKVALDAYAAILNTSTPILDNIRTVTRQRDVLNAQLSIEVDAVIESEELEQRQVSLACLNDLQVVWQESDYKIKQSSDFVKFITAVGNYYTSLEEHTNNLFRTWVKEMDAQIVEPEAILDLQRMVPDLRGLADKYDISYDNFKRLCKNLPGVVEAQELLAVCEEIKNVKAKMVLDLPESVKRFFETVSRSDGAPLKLLNEDVLQWLDEHGQTENYVIRRKGRSSW